MDIQKLVNQMQQFSVNHPLQNNFISVQNFFYLSLSTTLNSDTTAPNIIQSHIHMYRILVLSVISFCQNVFAGQPKCQTVSSWNTWKLVDLSKATWHYHKIINRSCWCHIWAQYFPWMRSSLPIKDCSIDLQPPGLTVKYHSLVLLYLHMPSPIL